jgi:hypothetical protein
MAGGTDTTILALATRADGRSSLSGSMAPRSRRSEGVAVEKNFLLLVSILAASANLDGAQAPAARPTWATGSTGSSRWDRPDSRAARSA